MLTSCLRGSLFIAKIKTVFVGIRHVCSFWGVMVWDPSCSVTCVILPIFRKVMAAALPVLEVMAVEPSTDATWLHLHSSCQEQDSISGTVLCGEVAHSAYILHWHCSASSWCMASPV